MATETVAPCREVEENDEHVFHPAPGTVKDNEEDESKEGDREEGGDDVQMRRDSLESDDSESSETECSDSD